MKLLSSKDRLIGHKNRFDDKTEQNPKESPESLMSAMIASPAMASQPIRSRLRWLGAVMLAAGLSGPLMAQTGAKPDPEAGAVIAQGVCAACHGPDGNSALPVNPNLAGQHAEYTYKQLSNFKSVDGKPPLRNNAIMAGFAASLSDADMRNLAAYFAQQTLKPAVATDKDLVELGQQIWRGGIAAKGVPSCAGCHGPTGLGMPAQYPMLQGQHAEYTAAQLTAWRQGERGNSAQMAAIASRLSDQEIKALAEYAAGLR